MKSRSSKVIKPIVQNESNNSESNNSESKSVPQSVSQSVSQMVSESLSSVTESRDESFTKSYQLSDTENQTEESKHEESVRSRIDFMLHSNTMFDANRERPQTEDSGVLNTEDAMEIDLERPKIIKEQSEKSLSRKLTSKKAASSKTIVKQPTARKSIAKHPFLRKSVARKSIFARAVEQNSFKGKPRRSRMSHSGAPPMKRSTFVHKPSKFERCASSTKIEQLKQVNNLVNKAKMNKNLTMRTNPNLIQLPRYLQGI